MYYDNLRDTMKAMHMIQLLDVVALTVDLPGRNLFRGQVGTIVEELAPDVFEVEFCDDEGHTYGSIALNRDQFIVLHFRPVKAA